MDIGGKSMTWGAQKCKDLSEKTNRWRRNGIWPWRCVGGSFDVGRWVAARDHQRWSLTVRGGCLTDACRWTVVRTPWTLLSCGRERERRRRKRRIGEREGGSWGNVRNCHLVVSGRGRDKEKEKKKKKKKRKKRKKEKDKVGGIGTCFNEWLNHFKFKIEELLNFPSFQNYNLTPKFQFLTHFNHPSLHFWPPTFKKFSFQAQEKFPFCPYKNMGFSYSSLLKKFCPRNLECSTSTNQTNMNAFLLKMFPHILVLVFPSHQIGSHHVSRIPHKTHNCQFQTPLFIWEKSIHLSRTCWLSLAPH